MALPFFGIGMKTDLSLERRNHRESAEKFGKESTCNVEDPDSIPVLGRSAGEGKKLPTPIFWPGELHGLYSPWAHRELDRTEQVSLSF